MNTLTNINIDWVNSNISFDIQLLEQIDTVNFTLCVDESTNIKNMYSEVLNDHNYCFDSSNCEITIAHVIDDIYKVTVENEMISGMSDHLKYISFNTNEISAEGIFYSSEAVYDAELTYIKQVCNNCLDDKCMQLLMFVVFKRQLLDSAISVNDCKQCLMLYNDLCRLLNVDTCNCDYRNYNEHSSCAVCSGGCCSLK